MVRQVLKMVYQEVRGLHTAAYVLALFTFSSQILALVRDRTLAHTFGAGMELDIYYTAFRIPDLMYVLFASTLSVYVLIPFVVHLKDEEGAQKARQLLSQVFSVFLIGYSFLALLLALFAPYLVSIFFPGFGEQAPLLVTLLRILLLQPLLLGISSLLGVVTQLSHRFVLYALSPLVYNIGIIIGVVALYPLFGLPGLGYGVLLGAFGHMAIQMPFVLKSKLAFSTTTSFDWKKLGEILRVSLPRAFTLSVNQLTLLVLVGIASIMTVGSVSVFQFAYNLQSVPVAIIGASYSVAAFPVLAQLFSKGELDRFRAHFITALRHIIFWSIPAIALIIVLRAEIVRVLLGSGAFDWGDTRLTIAVLAALSISLVTQSVILLVVRTFYAGGYTRTPFFTALFGASLSIICSIALYMWYQADTSFAQRINTLMRLDGINGSEVIVLGLGYSLGLILQSTILVILAFKTFSISTRGIGGHLMRSIAAAVVGGIACYGARNFFVFGVNAETFLGIFIQGALSGLVGLSAIALTYYVLRTPELREIYAAFHKRIFKTDVVKPERTLL